jgi:glycosyltransferase involved in cell wall biosynthesis
MYKPQNIAILTNFQDFNPGYSLSGIVADQVTMLKRYGHEVHLYTCESYNDEFDEELPCEVHHKIPFVDLVDYKEESKFSKEHEEFAKKLKNVLVEEFKTKNIEIAISHDWVFTGWNLPHSYAIRLANPHLHGVNWLHWIHSVPSDLDYPQGRDWWDIRRYGPNHKLIFPNAAERTRVAEQFKGQLDDVRVIPHIKDLRTWYDFDPETWKFIDDYPGVLQADIVQVYPAATDRLRAKQIDMVANLFARFKEKGFTVCLVIANQWATDREHEQDLNGFLDAMKQLGLRRDVEVIFTSLWQNGKYNTGLPKKILRELQLCSNLFVYPTVEESFGLVGPEAAIGGNYMVLNKSLYMMFEIFGNSGLYCDFGSYHNIFDPANIGITLDQYMRGVANLIIGRFSQNEVFQTRSWCRRVYNMDSLYNQVYQPIFAESRLWGFQTKAL